MSIDRNAIEEILHGQWVQRGPEDNPIFGQLDVEPYLGEEDANSEWSRHPHNQTEDADVEERDYVSYVSSAEDNFTHIPAYEEFKRPTNLFLYGRRGTGKTAIMRMTQHEVRRRKLAKYIGCWVFQSERFHEAMLDVLDELGGADGRSTFCAEVWYWVAWVSAIAETTKLGKSKRIVLDENTTNTLRQYLRSIGVNVGTGHWGFSTAVATHLRAVLDAGEPGLSVRRSRRAFLTRLKSEDFVRTRDATERVLNRALPRCVLVLIDSPDTFHLDQLPVFEGLLKALADIARAHQTMGLLCKASVPAEMYSYLNAFHPSRVGGTKELFIRWSHRDLVRLTATRIQGLFADRLRGVSDLDPESREDAQSITERLLPATVEARNGVTIRTMPYIVRHTQKTPRQLLFLLNSILAASLREDRRWEDLHAAPHLSIRNGVHGHLNHLIKTMIHVPNQIDPDFEEIITRSLTNGKNVFDFGSMDRAMKGLKELNEGHFDTREKRRRALINSGLVGIVRDTHVHRDSDVCVLAGSFEYQVKDTLHPNEADIFVAHPILYEYMRMHVSMKAMVYPYPYEDDEREVLEEMGIKVV